MMNAMKKSILLLLGISICLESLAGGVKSGPWVTEARTDRVTILWTSEVPGMAWVELSDGTKVWETFAGRHVFHRLHSIRIEGLQPGAELRYRVCGQELEDDSNARNPKFGDIYEGEWHSVRTFDPKAPECRFSVFNDVHNRTQWYESLAAQVDSASTDFLFLNGDIASAANHELDSFVHLEIEPLGSLPAGIPILFGRGNHEGRGNNVELVADVYPNADPAPFYYTFRQGPVAFIVFDAGETGKSRSILYSGSDVYEDYLNEQIAWAQKAMRDPLFRKAPVKVCLLHVPMIDHEDKTDYLLQRWLNVHIVPLLNKAGIDLMIGADLHTQMYCEPGTMHNDFPIFVNNEARRLDVVCSHGYLTLRSFHPNGTLEFEKTIKSR
jgi:hypothetical protein